MTLFHFKIIITWKVSWS